jgi:NAD(P)H dehydrogenase (quinone)
LPSDLGELIINIQKALAAGGFDIVTGDVERLAGRPPRFLEDALRLAFA